MFVNNYKYYNYIDNRSENSCKTTHKKRPEFHTIQITSKFRSSLFVVCISSLFVVCISSEVRDNAVLSCLITVNLLSFGTYIYSMQFYSVMTSVISSIT